MAAEDVLIRLRTQGARLAQAEVAGVGREVDGVGRKSRLAGKGAKVMAGGVLAVAAASGFAARKLFDLGSEFNDAYTEIRVGTGATGRALGELRDDFRSVVSSVPASFGDAATAVADLNTRLGLTGRPLRRASRQFLELSRMTRTDVGTNIEAITRAFGDWDVATGRQSRTLDVLWRASQASGATVDDLARRVVQFGAPLRQVGYDMNEAVAMFASFERAGVNVETMMPGLRQALRFFLERGVDPRRGLARVFAGIEDGTIGARKALRIFGARAGADMIEAIRQGRFEIGSLTRSLLRGGDTIARASRDTQHFSERWKILKNRLATKLEPIAMDVFDAAGEALDDLPGMASDVSDALGEIPAAWDAVRAGIGDGIRWIGEQFGLTGGDVEQAWDGIQNVAKAAFAAMRAYLAPFAAAAKAAFEHGLLPTAVRSIKGVIRTLRGFARVVGGVVKVVAGVLTGDFGKAWDGVKQIFSGSVQVVLGVIETITAPARTAIEGIWKGLGKLASAAFGAAKGAVVTGLNWIIDRVNDAIDVMNEAVGAANWLNPFGDPVGEIGHVERIGDDGGGRRGGAVRPVRGRSGRALRELLATPTIGPAPLAVAGATSGPSPGRRRDLHAHLHLNGREVARSVVRDVEDGEQWDGG